jgi:phosphatidate cytidylyltransferase
VKLVFDRQTQWLIAGVLTLLSVARGLTWVLQQRVKNEAATATVQNLAARVRAWWVMVLVFGAAVLTGGVGSVLLFATVSFLALREFITLTPSKPGDHRALFLVFFVILPLQYYLVAIKWYGMFSIFIPVYAFVLIPTRCAAAGDTDRFLERTAKIQWGLMVCVYFVSHAPALLTLRIPGFEGQNAKLLFFLVTVDQMSDVLQYVWGKSCGKRPVAPQVSPNKTVEGFVGGVLTATALGTGLWWLTPFDPWQAAVMSLLITLAGFFGGLVMSAIKRDRGVKDYGALIPGHGGIMDRIDSLCFAAPVFFHATRYYFT